MTYSCTRHARSNTTAVRISDRYYAGGIIGLGEYATTGDVTIILVILSQATAIRSKHAFLTGLSATHYRAVIMKQGCCYAR
jgi:hypothetical protein